MVQEEGGKEEVFQLHCVVDLVLIARGKCTMIVEKLVRDLNSG